MSNFAKYEQMYKQWWVGRMCRPVFSGSPYKLVDDLEYIAAPSGFVGVVELHFSDGTSTVVGGQSHRPTKKSVDVMPEPVCPDCGNALVEYTSFDGQMLLCRPCNKSFSPHEVKTK